MTHRTRTKILHSVVVGMGSTGLSSALALMIRGHDVTLIDKRSAYSLAQKVIIPQSLIDEYLEINVNRPFVQKLIKNHGLISLSKFQAFQLEVLSHVCENHFISYRNSRIPVEGCLTILRDENSEVTDVDPQKQNLKLSNGKTIKFDNIIDATGSKRHILQMIAKKSNNQYAIHYSTDIAQPSHQGNVILCISARTKYVTVSPINARRDYDLAEFTQNGWKEQRLPLYYLRAKRDKQQIYILCEIPDELVKEQNVEKILQFLKPILKKECDAREPALFNFLPDSVKLFSTFNLKHEIADKPFVELGKGGFAVVAGDARMPANFHFGHGVEKGILDGLNLIDAFNRHGKVVTNIIQERTSVVRRQVDEELEKQTTLIGLINFWRLSIKEKFTFLFHLNKNKDSLFLAAKAGLAALLLYSLSSSLAVICGLGVYACLKYWHVYASLSHKIPRVRSNENEMAFRDGILSTQSLSNYLLTFKNLQSYRHYYGFLEGVYHAKECNLQNQHKQAPRDKVFATP